MSDEEQPITRAELRAELAQLEARLVTALAGRATVARAPRMTQEPPTETDRAAARRVAKRMGLLVRERRSRRPA